MDMRLVGTLHAQIPARTARRAIDTAIAIGAAFDKATFQDLAGIASRPSNQAAEADTAAAPATAEDSNNELAAWLAALPM